MPSYISHAIMGEQIYEQSYKDEEMFKIPIDKDEIKGYSLGVDLSLISRRTKIDPQNYYTRTFFLRMLKNIKENKNHENKSVMALLYGHIAHYFLDINTHPLIYYIESKCQKSGLVSNHDLIEGYISSYLTQNILGKDIMDIKPDYFNKIDLSNPEISKLLNTTYGDIYGDYNIIRTYKITIKMFTALERIIKSGLISKKRLIAMSNFNEFLTKNNLKPDDLINEKRDTYINLQTKEKYNASFMELYKKSIEMTLEAILQVNKYLYSNKSLESLKSIFSNLSYDTGAPCVKPKKKLLTRKKA